MMQPEAIRELVRETYGAIAPGRVSSGCCGTGASCGEPASIAAIKPSPACCDSTLLATCCPTEEKSACCGDVTEAAAPSTCGCQPSAIRA